MYWERNNAHSSTIKMAAINAMPSGGKMNKKTNPRIKNARDLPYPEYLTEIEMVHVCNHEPIQNRICIRVLMFDRVSQLIVLLPGFGRQFSHCIADPILSVQ